MQTISFTIKKVTVIYRLINSLFFILVINTSFATEDLVSFCFEPQVNLAGAQKSLEFLLLPTEQVTPRQGAHCFEINTSPDRSKLLEKYLRKSYTLVVDRGARELGTGSLNNQNCQIELKTTNKKKINSTNVRVGSKNIISTVSKDKTEVSTSQLLLGLGKPGTLDLEGRSLFVECSGAGRDIYQLTFSYSEEYKSKVSTQVTVKRGEPVKIAEITNDLNSKSKTLGLPETLYQEATGAENISYELEIK
ncbi:MAG: hypothetical protein H7336_07345 [Bacteriovorax sp.]|nr:hypothetical protein [Bacteriovorax sp.]